MGEDFTTNVICPHQVVARQDLQAEVKLLSCDIREEGKVLKDYVQEYTGIHSGTQANVRIREEFCPKAIFQITTDGFFHNHNTH